MIQGDEAAYYADKAYDSKIPTGKARHQASTTRSPTRPSAKAAEELAEVVQHDSFERALRGRAVQRDNEELVWNGAGSVSGASAQQLPPAIRRLRDEHESAGLCCFGRLEPLRGEVCAN